MANKYAEHSRRASQERDKLVKCDGKVAYIDEESALADQPDQRAYECKYCGQWHTSARFQKLLSAVKRKAKRS